MNPKKGYFSIVQYCPDLARREMVNIGVVLLVPETGFLQARMVASNERVRHFFGVAGDDARRLRDFRRSFAARIAAEQLGVCSVEALQKFIDTRGNQIQMTQPQFVKVRQCAETLDELFTRMVGGAHGAAKQPSFKETISQFFAKAGVSNRILTDIPVSLPILEQEIRVPFGFRNGALHLLQTVQFHGTSQKAVFDRACQFSAEGRLVKREPHPKYGELELDIIGRFPSGDGDAVSIVRKVLAEENIGLYVEDDLSELAEEIRTTAKPLRVSE